MNSLRTPPLAGSAPRGMRLPPFDRLPVGDGSEALLCLDETSSLVHLSLALPTGAGRERATEAGIAGLTAAVMLAEVEAASEQLAECGVRYWSEPGWDFVRLCAEGPADLADSILDSLLPAVAEPTFSEESLILQRRVVGAQLRPAAWTLHRLAEESLVQALFGTARYGLPLLGTVETLQSITPEDLRRFHREHLLLSGIRLVAVGSWDRNRLSGGLRSLQPTDRRGGLAGAATPPEAGPNQRLVSRGGSHVEIRLGRPTVPLHHPDFLALQVLNAILGGGFASRLARRLRETSGLAYSASSRLEARGGPSPWILRTAVAPTVAGRAVVWIREEMERLRCRPPSAMEIMEAQGFLTGVLHTGLISSGEIARWLVHLSMHDLLATYSHRYGRQIGEIDRDRLHRLGRRLLHPQAWTLVAVGPDEGLNTIDNLAGMSTFGGSQPESKSSRKGGECHDEDLRAERRKGRVGRAGAELHL